MNVHYLNFFVVVVTMTRLSLLRPAICRKRTFLALLTVGTCVLAGVSRTAHPCGDGALNPMFNFLDLIRTDNNNLAVDSWVDFVSGGNNPQTDVTDATETGVNFYSGAISRLVSNVEPDESTLKESEFDPDTAEIQQATLTLEHTLYSNGNPATLVQLRAAAYGGSSSPRIEYTPDFGEFESAYFHQMVKVDVEPDLPDGVGDMDPPIEFRIGTDIGWYTLKWVPSPQAGWWVNGHRGNMNPQTFGPQFYPGIELHLCLDLGGGLFGNVAGTK